MLYTRQIFDMNLGEPIVNAIVRVTAFKSNTPIRYKILGNDAEFFTEEARTNEGGFITLDVSTDEGFRVSVFNKDTNELLYQEDVVPNTSVNEGVEGFPTLLPTEYVGIIISPTFVSVEQGGSVDISIRAIQADGKVVIPASNSVSLNLGDGLDTTGYVQGTGIVPISVAVEAVPGNVASTINVSGAQVQIPATLTIEVTEAA